MSEPIEKVVHRLLGERGATVAVAESITGGLLGAALTAVAGSSATFAGGVIAYSSATKSGLLGVSAELLAERGAVDPDVAVAMAEGVVQRLDAHYGLATTGVAGPEPAEGKPVGTVFVAVADPGKGVHVRPLSLAGDRARIRADTVARALELLQSVLVHSG